jgi:hypothetical protein
MANKSLESFGRLFVDRFYNRTITNWNKVKEDKINTSLMKLNQSQRDSLDLLIRSQLESAMFNFLSGLEGSDNIKIIVDEIDIAESSDGLSGELFGKRGWIARYGDQGK